MKIWLHSLIATEGEASVANLDKLRHAKGSISTAELRLEMQKTMQNHAGVFRTGELLEAGVKKMYDIYKKLDDIKVIPFEQGY